MNDINASARYVLRSEIMAVFNRVPISRRTGWKKFSNAVTLAMTDPDEPVDANVIGDAIEAYYASPDGHSEWARRCWTLVEDMVWNESPEAWQRGDGDRDTKWEGLK